MTDYESLIERAEIETGMDSHAPDCGFVDILMRSIGSHE